MQLSGPAYAGMPTRLNYQISNEGEGRFDVNWTDAIYLSDDEHLTPRPKGHSSSAIGLR